MGFPSADGTGVFVSKSDWALVGGFVMGLRAWIVAASGCIGAPR